MTSRLYLGKNLAPTSDLMIDCFYILVSIFIKNHDPELLIEKFVAELTCRQELISKEVWDKYPMIDESSLPKQVRERWMNWINQIPKFWFNSGKYDLNPFTWANWFVVFVQM